MSSAIFILDDLVNLFAHYDVVKFIYLGLLSLQLNKSLNIQFDYLPTMVWQFSSKSFNRRASPEDHFHFHSSGISCFPFGTLSHYQPLCHLQQVVPFVIKLV